MHDDEGMRGRLALTGEIHLTIVPGEEIVLSRAELTFWGTFDDPSPPVKLTLEGRHEELRKFRSVSRSLADTLDLQADAVGDGKLVLVARDDHIEKLREAASATPDAGPQDIFQNASWLAALFTLTGYEGESIGTVTRSSEPIS